MARATGTAHYRDHAEREPPGHLEPGLLVHARQTRRGHRPRRPRHRFIAGSGYLSATVTASPTRRTNPDADVTIDGRKAQVT
ncbi:MAG: hypothetical protein ACLS6O_00030 [Bifidobacterium sp.]